MTTTVHSDVRVFPPAAELNADHAVVDEDSGVVLRDTVDTNSDVIRTSPACTGNSRRSGAVYRKSRGQLQAPSPPSPEPQTTTADVDDVTAKTMSSPEDLYLHPEVLAAFRNDRSSRKRYGRMIVNSLPGRLTTSCVVQVRMNRN